MLYYLTLNVLHSLGNRKTFGTQNIVVDGVLNWLYLTLPGSSPNASDIIAAMEKHHSHYLTVQPLLLLNNVFTNNSDSSSN